MMIIELLNGNPKCTVIERMDGSVKLIGPQKEGYRPTFNLPSLEVCKEVVAEHGWEINVAFVRKIIRVEE